LDLVGLTGAAKKKTKGYSMGMRQRLGLAATLLGDPKVLILDEPANGLDPEGIRWLRGFFRHLAGEGRTVLVSSHQLAEIQEVADRAVILSKGRLVRSGTLAELSAGTSTAVVRGPDLRTLQQALANAGLSGSTEADGSLRVRAEDLRQIGHLAFVNQVELHELSMEEFDLEQLFFTLTEGDHRGANLDQRGAGR
jgi:ABC-2 type transport system ATP-binding protein